MVYYHHSSVILIINGIEISLVNPIVGQCKVNISMRIVTISPVHFYVLYTWRSVCIQDKVLYEWKWPLVSIVIINPGICICSLNLVSYIGVDYK